MRYSRSNSIACTDENQLPIYTFCLTCSWLTLSGLFHPTLSANIVDIQDRIIDQLVLIASTYRNEDSLFIRSETWYEGERRVCAKQWYTLHCAVGCYGSCIRILYKEVVSQLSCGDSLVVHSFDRPNYGSSTSWKIDRIQSLSLNILWGSQLTNLEQYSCRYARQSNRK
jgi:hypothetical protein